MGLIPGLGIHPGEGNGNPLQCSCLENPGVGGQIGKGLCQGCILSPCLINLYAENIMRTVRLDEAQAGINEGVTGIPRAFVLSACGPYYWEGRPCFS